MSTEERRVQLVAEVDTTRTRAGFQEIGQQAGQMAQQVIQAGERAERAVTGVGAGAAPAARNVDAASRSIIGSIERATAAMQAGGRASSTYYETLARQRGIDPGVLRPYLDQLRSVEQAQARTAASAGASAGQINAALRGLPAQITDVVTSLQGGQAPLTVFLQQGGQIRDQFGSAGAAVRGLSSYLLGMVNPLTVSAAGIGVLALAYKSGADEAGQFERSIILSGNAAGATSAKLADMSRNVAAIAGSRGAADAVAALVETAQVPADSLQKFAVVAIGAQQVLGRSVQDTVGDFEKLGKAPLQALAAIDEKFHFISASTFEQVRALESVGKTTEAANIAQQAYAAGVQDQKDKVLATLNSWEKAWLGLKMYASDAANAVVDFAGGRETSNVEKINKLLDERTSIEENLERAKKRGLAADVLAYQAELDANKRAINAIRDKADAQNASARAAAEAQKADDVQKQWAKDSEKYLTRQAQLTRDLATARNEGEVAWANLKPEEREKKIADRLVEIRRQYSDIFNAGVESNIAALRRRDAVEDLLAQRSLARIQSQRALGSISEEQAINETAKTEIAEIDRSIATKRAELAQLQNKIYVTQEQKSKDLKDKEGEIEDLRIQRGTREEKRENDLLLLQQKRAQATEDLYTKGTAAATAERNSLVAQLETQFQYNAEIGLSTTQVAELRAARLSNAAALKDESAAALEAVDPNSQLAATYREQAQAMRDLGEAQVRGAYKDQMVTQWRQAVDQYGQVFQQGFADMLNNGRDGWSSFTKSLVTTFKTSVADQIYKMLARPIIVQLVGNYLGVSQQAIAGEIASQPNAYGITSASGPIGAAQAASSLYGTLTGGMTLGGGLGTGFMGSLAGGLEGVTGASAAARLGLTSNLGVSIGNSIAGVVGPSVASGIATGLGALATALPWVSGALAVGSLWKSAFGHGDTEVQGQGIRGTVSASSLTGTAYQKLHQDGGWFSSDRDWEKPTDFTAEMAKQFTQGLSSLETSAAGFASALGVQADWISSYSKSFDLALTGDKAKDEQVIAEFFQSIGDEIAQKLVPNLTDFAKSGEALSATLERLAGDFKGTDQVAQLLGFSADKLFGSSGLGSAAAREQLITMAGGLSALNSQAAFFNQNFLTDAERIKPVAEALDKALASLGLDTIPTTRDEFKSLVNSLILSGAAATESGSKQLESLLALGEAFAQVHPAVDAAAQAVDAAAEAATKAAEALQAMKDAASGLLGGVDSAYSVLQRVVDREKKAMQSSVDAHSASVAKLQTLSQALHSTLDSIKSPDQKAMERAVGQAQIRAALAIAKAGGPLPDSDSLKNALSAVTQDASSQFGSYQDYLRDLYQTQNDIAQLGDLTDSSLTVEQQALKAAQDQLKSLDDQLAKAQEQIDILKGIDTNGLSLVQAMEGLRTAILGAQANPIVAATSGINSAYQQYLGRAPDAAGLDYFQKAAAGGMSVDAIKATIAGSAEAQVQKLYSDLLGRPADAGGLSFFLGSGASTSDIAAAIKSSDEYKKLHPFAIGTNFVPEDMPAYLHRGEAVIPAYDNRLMMSVLSRASSGSGVDVSELVNEVRELRKENAELRQVMADGMRAIAGHTSDTASHLDDVVNGRKPIPTEVVQTETA